MIWKFSDFFTRPFTNEESITRSVVSPAKHPLLERWILASRVPLWRATRETGLSILNFTKIDSGTLVISSLWWTAIGSIDRFRELPSWERGDSTRCNRSNFPLSLPWKYKRERKRKEEREIFSKIVFSSYSFVFVKDEYWIKFRFLSNIKSVALILLQTSHFFISKYSE